MAVVFIFMATRPVVFLLAYRSICRRNRKLFQSFMIQRWLSPGYRASKARCLSSPALLSLLDIRS